nr:hypothetical protein BHI3_09190 [Bacteriovorax sp. HI3]
MSQASTFKVEVIKKTISYLDESFTTQGNLYLPENPRVEGIVYLYPTISGPSPLEKTTARYFARRGFAVIIPDPVALELNVANPDVEQLDRDYFKPAQAAMGLIAVVDEKIKNEVPVFALGASQGGIRALGLAAESSRVKAAWFAVAGGNFPLVYATSTVKKITTLRQNHMAKLGFTDPKDYELYLRANLKNDPLYSCEKIKIPFVQVIALDDDKVPTSTQLELKEACPPHKVIQLDGGHVKGASTIYFYRARILDFFRKQISN